MKQLWQEQLAELHEKKEHDAELEKLKAQLAELQERAEAKFDKIARLEADEELERRIEASIPSHLKEKPSFGFFNDNYDVIVNAGRAF